MDPTLSSPRALFIAGPKVNWPFDSTLAGCIPKDSLQLRANRWLNIKSDILCNVECRQLDEGLRPFCPRMGRILWRRQGELRCHQLSLRMCRCEVLMPAVEPSSSCSYCMPAVQALCWPADFSGDAPICSCQNRGCSVTGCWTELLDSTSKKPATVPFCV